MQRLYSMFPHGGPGIGLLLLRIAAAGMFALNVVHGSNVSKVLYWLGFSIVALVSLGLLIGLVTPILAIITCIAAAANLFLAGEPNHLVYIVRILTATALFLLGPGAYSIDARLFGLRVTVVPPRTNTI